MRKLLSKLWADDGGFNISVEMLFITVILVIGLIAGLAGLRAAIVTEFTELGNAILALNEGYTIQQIAGDTGGSFGSQAFDNLANLQIIATTPANNVIDETALANSGTSVGTAVVP